MVADTRKREISLEVQTALKRLEARVSTLEETIAFVDQIEAADPGDERQKNFYAAIRQLATKVASHLPVVEKEI